MVDASVDVTNMVALAAGFLLALAVIGAFLHKR